MTHCLWLVHVVVCSALAFGAFAAAVGAQALGSTSSVGNKSIAQTTPSLASMAHAFRSQDYTVEQFRRFRTENGQVTTVRERLTVDANGTAKPDFLVEFLSVEGEPAGSALSLEWQETYERFGRKFFLHGTFQVRNLAKATANYSLHGFGQVVRAGRVARRYVVYPSTADKAIWIVDVDGLTSVPLYVAEFDNQLRVMSEVEAISFTTASQSFATADPAVAITEVPDFAAALAVLSNTHGIVNPNVLATPDYVVDTIEVHFDPINGSEKLVMRYVDGIDQFSVEQAPNSQDPFGQLPVTVGGTRAIGRFRDPAVSALVFWDDDVVFHVAGRGSLRRLDDVAKAIFRQALTN